MKKKIRSFALAITAMLLGVTILFGTVLQAETPTDPADAWNFGKENVESNRTLAPSVLWEKLLGRAPSDIEKDWLDSHSGISLTYNSAIPDSVVETEYDGEQGILNVSVIPYTYQASNGATVVWVPQKAKLESREEDFTESANRFVCSFDNVLYSGNFEIEVDFAWSVTLPSAEVDAFLGSPYQAAQDALNAILAYEAELADFNDKKAKYDAYEEYLRLQTAFEHYSTVDLPAYQAKLQKYEPYRIAHERYQKDLAAYEAWQQYWAYQEFISDDVQTKYLAYQAYLKELAPIEDRLDILDTLFITDSHGWQLYKSLMGGTVEQVLNEKDKLIEYKKEFKKHINNAEESTKVLKTLLKEYNDLRKAKYPSDHAKVAALYAFYTQNYATLKTHFSQLYNALNTMGSDSGVVIALSEKGQLEHYYQFVGQLYVTQACLNDRVELNEREIICGQYLDQVVEPVQMITDRTASPDGVRMPEIEVPKVDKVEQIAMPDFDEIREKPILSSYVNAVLQEREEWKDWEYADLITEEPTAPDVVQDPDPVDYAPYPGNSPTAPKIPAALINLAEALRKGTLIQRALGQDKTLTFTESISCSVSISNLKTVTFYSADGKTVLDRQTLEYGSRIEYHGPDTARESDAQYHYAFRAWVLWDGNAPDMVATSNMSLYAYYLKTPRFYNVTWVLDGVTEVRSLAYGQMPISPFPTEKQPDAMHIYTFSGWDKEIVPVTGDVTYTGSFQSTLRTYTVTWQVGERSEQETLPYGSLPSFTGDLSRAPDQYKYTFMGWNSTPTPVTGDVTYTANYLQTPLAQDTAGTVLNVKHFADSIAVIASANRVDVREAALLAVESEKVLTIRWGDFYLSFTPDQLSLMLNSYCRQIGIIKSENTDTGIVYTVGYLNSAGQPLEMSLSCHVEIVPEKDGQKQRGYALKDDAWERIEADGADLGGTLSLRVCHVYTLEVISDEPCNLLRFPTVYEEGEIVDLSLIGCVFGHEITSAAWSLSGQAPTLVQNLRFEMPHGNVSLQLTIQPVVYRVSFVVDGVTVHTAEYFMGEEIELPTDPQKASDGQYTYRFLKWTPDVGIAYGDVRELVFEAVFISSAIGNDDFTPDRSLFKTVLTVALVGLAVLALCVTLTVILIRRRRKKRKAQKEKSAEGMQTEQRSKSTQAEQPLESLSGAKPDLSADVTAQEPMISPDSEGCDTEVQNTEEDREQP